MNNNKYLKGVIFLVVILSLIIYANKLFAPKNDNTEVVKNVVDNNIAKSLPSTSLPKSESFTTFITDLRGKEITKAEFDEFFKSKYESLPQEDANYQMAGDLWPEIDMFGGDEDDQTVKEIEKFLIEDAKGGITRLGGCLIFTNESMKKEFCDRDNTSDTEYYDKEYYYFLLYHIIENDYFVIREWGYEYNINFLVDQKTLERKKTIGFDRLDFSPDLSKVILSYRTNPADGDGRTQIFLVDPWTLFVPKNSIDEFISSPWILRYTNWLSSQKVILSATLEDEKTHEIETRYGLIIFP